MNQVSLPGGRHAVLLVLISCLPILGTLLIAPVLPDMARHFADQPGVGYLVPFVQTAPAFTLAVIGSPIGRLAARAGRKRILILSLLLYAAAAPLPLMLPSLGQIIVSRLIVGVAEAGVMTTATTLIGDYFTGAKRDRYLAMQVLASSCSAVVFIAAGGFLGSFGWRAPFLAYLAPALLIPFALSLLSEPVHDARSDPISVSGPLPWRRLSRVLCVTFLAGLCMNLMSVEIGFIIDALGEHRSSVIGIAAAINSGGIVVGSFVFGNMPHSSEKPSRLVAALLTAALGYLLLYLAAGAAAAAAAGGIAGLGCGFYLPWLLAEANREVSFAQRGQVNGMWLSAYFFAVVAGPPAATALSGVTGSLQDTMVIFSLGLGLLAVAVAVLFRRASEPVVGL